MSLVIGVNGLSEGEYRQSGNAEICLTERNTYERDAADNAQKHVHDKLDQAEQQKPNNVA
jgi:hypothetical protein